MAFPEIKNTWIGKIKVGWEDLGEVDRWVENESTMRRVHNFCNRTLKIGREGDELFQYCPRCMVKMEAGDNQKGV